MEPVPPYFVGAVIFGADPEKISRRRFCLGIFSHLSFNPIIQATKSLEVINSPRKNINRLKADLCTLKSPIMWWDCSYAVLIHYTIGPIKELFIYAFHIYLLLTKSEATLRVVTDLYLSAPLLFIREITVGAKLDCSSDR